MGLKDDLPIVLVFGGSQGARSINETMIDIIKNNKNSNYQVIWAAGQTQYDIIKEKLEDNNIVISSIKNTKIVPYIYNMEEVLNACDLVVARSGAMTITEISKVGKPGIFIPQSGKSIPRYEKTHVLPDGSSSAYIELEIAYTTQITDYQYRMQGV